MKICGYAHSWCQSSVFLCVSHAGFDPARGVERGFHGQQKRGCSVPEEVSAGGRDCCTRESQGRLSSTNDDTHTYISHHTCTYMRRNVVIMTYFLGFRLARSIHFLVVFFGLLSRLSENKENTQRNMYTKIIPPQYLSSHDNIATHFDPEVSEPTLLSPPLPSIHTCMHANSDRGANIGRLLQKSVSICSGVLLLRVILVLRSVI